MVARSSGRSAANAAMTARPRPERTARISMTLSVPASSRTDTAIAENDSNAPVIQRTTRTSCGSATRDRSGPSLRVRLVLRPRLVEGRELAAGGVGRDDLRKSIKRHLQAARVVDLRHQADVGQRDLAAEAVWRRLDHRLQGLE